MVQRAINSKLFSFQTHGDLVALQNGDSVLVFW